MSQSLEERVAYLEGKVEEQTKGFGGLIVRISGLDQKVDRFRAELSSRIDALSVRVDALDNKLSSRIDAIDQKIDRFREELSGQMSRQFLWLVGLQMATVLAIIGALGALLRN